MQEFRTRRLHAQIVANQSRCRRYPVGLGGQGRLPARNFGEGREVRVVKTEGVFNRSHAGGEASVVATKQFAERRSADQSLQRVGTSVNGVAMPFV